MSYEIGRRYRGPASSGNGGYSAGITALAHGHALGPATVTLRVPPPLDTPLRAETDHQRTLLFDADELVSEVVAAQPDEPAVPEVSLAEAIEATMAFPWYDDHPYPECFVCGTARGSRDGLLIHPGPVEGRAIAAAPWTPDESVGDEAGLVRPEVAWASLDCPTLFGFVCFNRWEGPLLLGRFTVRLHRTPRVGEPCVTMGWMTGRDGRKHYCAGALVTAEGELIGVSEATWLSVPSADPKTNSR